MSTRSVFRRARLDVLLLLAVSVATAGLLVAPGLAGAVSSTEITARAQSSTITWGGSTILTGTLMDLGTLTALGGLSMDVEWSHVGSPTSWQWLATVTTEEGEYATGQYTKVVHPRELTYYHFVFKGNGAYAPSVSKPVTIKVRPYLGRPLPPKVVKKGKLFTVPGTLKPRFPAGTKTVKIRVYRAKGGTWVVVKRLWATNVDTTSYSKYVLSTRLTSKGKYRFLAYTAATTAWAPGQSLFSRTLVVK
jgi:hypothetical protein